MPWCHWLNCWHHVTPASVPMGHWPKSDIAPHINHLDLKNAVAPLMVLSTSNDADTNAVASHDTKATGIGWYQCWYQWHHTTKKSHVAPHFNCLDLRNAMAILMILLAQWDNWCQCLWYQMTKKSCYTSFNCSDLRNAIVPFMIPLASCDANNSASVALYIYYLD